VAVHPRIAVNTMCLGGTTLEEDCAWARSIGVHHISIAPQKLDACGWAEGIAIVRDSGLAVATVVNPVLFTLEEPTTWPAQHALGRKVIDAAVAMGATSIYGVTGPGGRLTWEQGAAAYRDAVAPIRDYANEQGIALALEPTNPLRIPINLCHSLRDVAELAALAVVSVCVDVYGCFGEAHLDATIAKNVGNIAHVQISDFVYGTLDTPNRAVPGDGDLPLARILSWLLEAGYGGPIDLELNGPRIDAEGHRAATARGVERLSEILNSLGA